VQERAIFCDLSRDIAFQPKFVREKLDQNAVQIDSGIFSTE
jgi:hypothetical protein